MLSTQAMMGPLYVLSMMPTELLSLSGVFEPVLDLGRSIKPVYISSYTILTMMEWSILNPLACGGMVMVSGTNISKPEFSVMGTYE